jgi:hypothetical protein
MNQCNCTLNNYEEDITKECYKDQIEKNIKNCSRKYVGKFNPIEECQDYCPLECDSMNFQIIPFFEPLPTNGKISNATKISMGLSRFNTYEQVNNI